MEDPTIGRWERYLQPCCPLPSAPIAHENASRPCSLASCRIEWIMCDSDAMYQVRELREALDLLTLISRVNASAWRRELMRLWPDTDRLWLQDNREHDVFVVGIAIKIGESTDVFKINEELLELAPRENIEYVRHRQRILSTRPDQIDDDASNFSWIPVRLEAENVGDREYEHLLAALAQLVLAQQAQLTNARSSVAISRSMLEIVEVSLDPEVEISEREVRALVHLASSGVHVRNIPPVTIENDTEMDEDRDHQAHSFVQSVRYLLLESPSIHQSPVANRTLTVSLATSPLFLPALLSAAQVASSLHTIRLQFDDDEEEGDEFVRLWRWVSYTLLSCHAEHHINRLEIDCRDFSQAYMDAMHQILQATNPLYALTDEESCESETDSAQWISCSKFFLFDQETDKPSRAVHKSTNPITVRIVGMHRVNSLFTVLLPGWGKAWAYAQDCHDAKIESSDHSRTSAWRSFEELSLVHVSHGSIQSCCALLRLIGREVRMLELDLENEALLDTLLKETARHFGHLEEVRVQTDVASLGNFLQIVSEQGVPIRKLSLTIVGPEDPLRLRQFFETLGDVTHVLTTHLQELSMNFNSNNGMVEALETLKNALQVNRRLHTLELTLPEFNDEIVDILEPSRKKIPYVRLAPLAFVRKLAFLTVVRLSHNSPLGQFDSGILETIFQFAAHGRNLRFEIYTIDVLEIDH